MEESLKTSFYGANKAPVETNWGVLAAEMIKQQPQSRLFLRVEQTKLCSTIMKMEWCTSLLHFITQFPTKIHLKFGWNSLLTLFLHPSWVEWMQCEVVHAHLFVYTNRIVLSVCIHDTTFHTTQLIFDVTFFCLFILCVGGAEGWNWSPDGYQLLVTVPSA